MPPERRFPPRSVLVVDHDKDPAERLAAPLRHMGSDVEVAPDGPSALAVERTFRPDIVLIDLGLPGMDAYTVARFLRAQPQPATVPGLARQMGGVSSAPCCGDAALPHPGPPRSGLAAFSTYRAAPQLRVKWASAARPVAETGRARIQ